MKASFVVWRLGLAVVLAAGALVWLLKGPARAHDEWAPLLPLVSLGLALLAAAVVRDTIRCWRRTQTLGDSGGRLSSEPLAWMGGEVLLLVALPELGSLAFGPGGFMVGFGLGVVVGAFTVSRRGVHCVREFEIAWRAKLRSLVFPRMEKTKALEVERETVDRILVPGLTALGSILVAIGVVLILTR